jgi:hypothetical protein
MGASLGMVMTNPRSVRAVLELLTSSGVASPGLKLLLGGGNPSQARADENFTREAADITTDLLLGTADVAGR